MEDIVPSEEEVDDANKLDDEPWCLEDIVNTADQSNIATREALTALGVKCRSAGFTVSGTFFGDHQVSVRRYGYTCELGNYGKGMSAKYS